MSDELIPSNSDALSLRRAELVEGEAWQASAGTPMGKVRCTRTFTPILRDKYVQLIAKWEFGNKVYEEFAIYGVSNGKLSFWSFTSDGKKSEGVIADGKEIDPQAIVFEAEMPAGLARMMYWPNTEGGFNWAVEAKNKKAGSGSPNINTFLYKSVLFWQPKQQIKPR